MTTEATIFYVGKKEECDITSVPSAIHGANYHRWRDPKNVARVDWKVNGIPTIVRLEEVNYSIYGGVRDVADCA